MNIDKQLLEMMKKEVPELYALEHYTIRGKPITFEIQPTTESKKLRLHRPWQVDILNDTHPDKVVRKSRQLGLSELSVLENLWFVDTKHAVKTMQTFPRARQITDFVKTRLNPVIQQNPYYKGVLDKMVDSIEVKKIRESFMMFRSGWGSALAEGADLDAIFMDEIDRQDPDVVTAFKEGLKSSEYGWIRRWSTPTIPGRGIDLLFQKSDQRFYMHKCEHCNHYQVLDPVDNIIQVDPKGVDVMNDLVKDGTFIFACAKCKRELNRWKGEWVSKYPSIDSLRGYHISQLDAVWISADDVKRREMTYTSKQLFHNYVIGIPFASEGMIINEDDMLANKRYEAPVNSRRDYTKVVCGIDWNKTNYCVVVGIKGDGSLDLLNYFGFEDNPNKPLEAVGKLAASIKPYDPDLIVADEGYGADRNSYLMQLFPGRTWACRYQTYKGKSKPLDSWNEASRIVIVDKTLKVQRMLHLIKGRGLGMWRMDERLQLLYKHLHNTRIMTEEEDDAVYEVATRVKPCAVA